MDAIKLVIDQNVIPALSHALISIRNYTASIVLEAQERSQQHWSLDLSLSIEVGGLSAQEVQTAAFILDQALTVCQSSNHSGGLESQKPQTILSAPSLWLEALKASQAASDRILHDLHSCEANISFWQQILDQGSHFRFQLLSMGPTAFVRHLVSTLRVASDFWSGKGLTLPPSSSPSASAASASSATHNIQHRIIVFRGLRNHLSTALAEVHLAAAALRAPLTLFLEASRGSGKTNLGDPLGLDLSQRILKAASSGASTCGSSILRVLKGLDEVNADLQRSVRMTMPSDTPVIQGGMEIGRAVCLASALAQGQTGGDFLSPPYAKEQLQELGGNQQGLIRGGQRLTPVGAALLSARAAASRAGPLVPLPGWLAMPSRLQRYWVTYAMRGAVAVSCAVYLLRHSSLAGSDDLKRWSSEAAQAVKGAWQEHVVEPLNNIKSELFKTFRDRPCESIVSIEEYEADLKSLARMLEDFEKDRPGLAALGPPKDSVPVVSTGPSDVVSMPNEASPSMASGMQLVMRSYEDEIRRPLRSLLLGDLAQAMLIQVQRMKLDSVAAMLKLDQILKATELSLSVVAALPGLAFTWILFSATASFLMPRAPDVKRKAVRLRLAAAGLQRALQDLHHLQKQPGKDCDPALGCALLHLARVRCETNRLFHGFYDRTSSASEFPGLRSDVSYLMRLAAEQERTDLPEQVLERMLRSYRVFA